jgi:hypothetical protein
MKRRDFVTSVLAAGLAAPAIGASDAKPAAEQDHGGHGGNANDNGRKGRIVDVSFGHWGPTVNTPPGPLDRFTGDPNDRTRNVHQIMPNPIKVKAGDVISFHISGLHNPQIFGPGTLPTDINVTNTVGAPAIINDNPNNSRFFRGLDPRVLNAATPPNQDRVENVSAPEVPGRYLVICGVKVHFVDAAGNFIMFAFMDVEPADN